MSKAPPPLWLDYQRPPPGRETPGRILLGISLLLGLILLIASGQLADERDELAQSVHRQRPAAGISAGFSASTGGSPESAPPGAERWDALFGTLEAAGDDSVTLLSLAPTNRNVRIAGEARDLTAALAYAQRLQSAATLGDVHLEDYEVMREHPRQPVRFTLQANWREATR